MPAILATKTLWETPGFKSAGVMEPTMTAAAAAGLNPARTIIAAGVFAAGLRAAGVVDVFVNYLTHAQEVAKLGGALGPFVLALLTGSGDAAAFAFNEAVTPHAAQFGLTVDGLGYLAALAGGVGRPASPLCGGLILVAGIAAVSPVEVAKRTAPAMVLCLIALYILI